MFLEQVFNAGAIPVLERSVQFAARRQELLAHNIANASTPGFQPADVSVRSFQKALAAAADRRRAAGAAAPFDFRGTREVRVTTGGLRLTPETPSANILFHDRNNRDLERMMQSLVENLTQFRVATDMLRGRMEIINAAIRERI